MRVAEIAGGVRQLRLGAVDLTAGIVAGEGGLLVVDPGHTIDGGRAVRAHAERAFGLPVRWLVATHGHWDHVFGAAAFGRGASAPPYFGCLGLAEELAPGRDGLADGTEEYGVPRAEAEEAVRRLRLPDREVDAPLVLDLGGGRRVRLLHPGPGHTGHDLTAVVTGRGERPVVFCGDLVEESGPPQSGPDAFPARWPAALDRLLAEGGEDAVYVPGHGAPVDAAFVRRQRDDLASRPGGR